MAKHRTLADRRAEAEPFDLKKAFNLGAAHSRADDPDTSKEAADSIKGQPLADLQAVVIASLARLGGEGTSEDVAGETGINLQSITPRFRPLVGQGYLVDTGKQKPGSTGKKRIVWGLTAKAIVWVNEFFSPLANT